MTAGFTDQGVIDLAGAGFQAAIVLGGIVLGGYVDRTKEYKQTTLFCLAASLLLLFPFGLDGSPKYIVIPALLALGALVGPVQPINAECAPPPPYARLFTRYVPDALTPPSHRAQRQAGGGSRLPCGRECDRGSAAAVR